MMGYLGATKGLIFERQVLRPRMYTRGFESAQSRQEKRRANARRFFMAGLVDVLQKNKKTILLTCTL